jgi:hypothetical protein
MSIADLEADMAAYNASPGRCGSLCRGNGLLRVHPGTRIVTVANPASPEMVPSSSLQVELVK